MLFDRSNDPNAGRLIESLRHLGYGNYEALADIVDNSIDAEAKLLNIRILLRDKQHEISIADDGTGMDFATLDQAMRLGSLTSRNQNSDLGKFGMGLVTASLSIARRCHVITRGPDGCLSSAWDVDEIIEQNAFIKHLATATDEEEAILTDAIGSHTGTILLLTKIDNLSNKNTSSFASNLKSHLGRVHRYFIDAGLSMIINGELIEALDPLQLSDEATEIVIDETLPIIVDHDGIKVTENVRARIVLVSDTPSNDLEIKRSMKAQGFYVMRNQREVMDASTLGFFTKHGDFNRMRGEIFFPGTLDRLVGIEFTKRQVDFDQSLQDQLNHILVPTCRSIKKREANKKRVETSPAQEQLHRQSAKSIAEKDKLLIKPKARIEKRASPTNSGDNGKSVTPPGDRERKNLNRTQALADKLGCEIREERLGPNGQIYECDMEGRKVILRYNVEHPFYQRFVVDNISDTRIVTAADFLIYSMASAELKILDDGETDVLNNFKLVLSANLRTLLN